ncbi:sodium- and chloride-dependent neutral and basic amino acid transporter B(0+)-like [Harmonia axyridis]|uniref:sodium- and chloride-dependent neutral and basic amino acid transporter B(0+)-like n=1 Tax=Harmonia axyridis TaxID=115357 RepID=UPI001E275624|nr:sodium- and chloride-dependent neutral and basic amino acid transporter B(0+)-like [Harmonia axyridis]
MGEGEYGKHQKESTKISKSKEEIVKEIQVLDWEDEREHFSSRMYYILALMQICLSFNGLFACPLATLNHGGITFFIPYTLFTILFGYPIHFMECSLGQYSQLGPVKVWNCVPLARGIGLASIFLCLIVAFYNNVYAIYAVMYFSRCFDKTLPWSDCDYVSYNNKSCVPRMAVLDTGQMTPSQHYFYDHILQLDLTEHVGHYHFGGFIWQQGVAFIYSWFVVYLGVFQNIKSLERVLPLCVGIPLFGLLVFLSIGVQLRGAFRGLIPFFSPTNFLKLRSISTWSTAAEIVLMQLGIAQGTLIMYGSYAYHRNKTQNDSKSIICTNYAISLGTSFIVWLFLGSLVSERNSPPNHPYELGDFSFVFVILSEVLGRLSGARIWCIILYVLIFISCMNSQIALIQTVVCSIYDQCPQLVEVRSLINLALCMLFACFGILMCTKNSWVLLQSFYEIPDLVSRTPIASLTVAVIVLIYGVNKYCEDLHFLIDYYPSFVMRLLFYVAPFLMLGLYLGNNWKLFYPFSDGDFSLFKFLLYLILIWKPIGFLYWVLRSAINGKLKDCWRSLESWGPGNEKARIARAFFSSESKVTLSMPWRKKVED